MAPSRGSPERAREEDGVLPLVLTLLLEDAAQERFDRLRAQHFPAERNHLAAHVTLFHALPGDQLSTVDAVVAEAARRPPFAVSVTGVRLLGGGVAYDLQATELTALRDRLATAWSPWLTRQDAQRHHPHVTVQNKVRPERARALHQELTAHFVPEQVQARGLGLWRYLGGPWEPVGEHLFAG